MINQAPKKQGQHVVRIDVLRAIACLLVFYHHYWINLYCNVSSAYHLDQASTVTNSFLKLLLFPVEFGYLGVQLFFLISGFCIHASYLGWRERTEHAGTGSGGFWKLFFWRRFWRIYPPYVIVLVLAYLIAYREAPFSWASLKHLGLHLSLLHNFFPWSFYDINGVFWSLAVECQLYLVYPLFVWAVCRFGIGRAFLVCSVIAFIFHLVLPLWFTSYAILKLPFAYWYEWTLGALLADAYQRKRSIFMWHAVLLPVLIGLTYWAFTKGGSTPRYLFAPLLFAVLMETYLGLRAGVSRWERALVPVGLCSYSIYMVHQIYITYLTSLISPWLIRLPGVWVWSWVFILLYVVPVLGACWFFYHFIEMGSIDLGKRLWKRCFERGSAGPKLGNPIALAVSDQNGKSSRVE